MRSSPSAPEPASARRLGRQESRRARLHSQARNRVQTSRVECLARITKPKVTGSNPRAGYFLTSLSFCGTFSVMRGIEELRRFRAEGPWAELSFEPERF